MNTTIHLKLALLLLVAVGVLVVLGGQQLDAKEDPASRAFYEQLQQIKSVEQVESFLDTADPQNARLVIIRLVDLSRDKALPTLRSLWAGDGRDLSRTIRHMDTYQHPIARLTLAAQLMALSPMPEYGNYIKRAVGQDSWIVRSVAAEALAFVDDAESVDLLMQLVRSENPLVAEDAIASLSYLARSGASSTEASQAIQELHRDPRIKQESVKREIAKAYEGVPPYKPAAAPTGHDQSLDEQIQPYLEKQQYQAAIDVVLPAAESGNVRAQHLVGELYLARNPPDYDRAREWLQKAVNQGYAPAKTSLANLYLSGRGVAKDEAEAVRLLQEAEQQGDQSAHQLLDKARKQGWWGM